MICVISSLKNSDEMGVISPTPDNTLFQSLAKLYSLKHGTMALGELCGEHFPGGITNGAFWYNVNGMAPLNFWWHFLRLTFLQEECRISITSIQTVMKLLLSFHAANTR